MTSPISTALACTNELGSTTGVTPLMAQTFIAAASSGNRGTMRIGCPLSSDPAARVAEHPHPRRVLAPVAGMPRHLHAAEYALRMRHQYGKTPVGRRESGDALRRPVRIVRVSLGRRTAVVDEAQGHQRFGRGLLPGIAELGVSFAVGERGRNPAAFHPREKQRR